jgi:hypothetical protein
LKRYSQGGWHLQAYATDPSDATRSGVVVMADANGYGRLKAIIENADEVIDHMIRARRIKRMVLHH